MPADPARLRIALLSDTHAPRFWKACPAPVAAVLDGVDAILHAGDVCVPSVIEELSAFAPVHVVRGNNDPPRWDVPETLEVELGGVRFAMIHDSGLPPGRGRRLHERFPEADVVVFGHSHIPWDETYGGQRHLNPGSPTDKRRQPHRTMREVVVEQGRVVSARLITVDPPAR